jgi:hypothetical protein
LLVKTNSQGWLVLAIMAVITGLLAAGAATPIRLTAGTLAALSWFAEMAHALWLEASLTYGLLPA